MLHDPQLSLLTSDKHYCLLSMTVHNMNDMINNTHSYRARCAALQCIVVVFIIMSFSTLKTGVGQVLH